MPVWQWDSQMQTCTRWHYTTSQLPVLTYSEVWTDVKTEAAAELALRKLAGAPRRFIQVHGISSSPHCLQALGVLRLELPVAFTACGGKVC